MKTLYDELYAKSPDIMGRPVHVANPDPLRNSTKINDNGTYDVSSFAEVKVDVEGSSCGGGLDNPKLHVKVINNSSETGFFTSARSVLLINNNAVVMGLDSALPINTGTSEANYLVIQNIYDGSIHGSTYVWDILGIDAEATSSDYINCTDEGKGSIEITDMSKDASVTITLTDIQSNAN